jgi:vacuolar-type H+-ATPase subunit H
VQEEAATRARKAARQARQAKKDARKRAEQAQGRAREASDKAAKRLQELRADYVPAAAEKAQQARDTVRHVAERVAS